MGVQRSTYSQTVKGETPIGGKSEAPPPPDYSQLAAASQESAKISAQVAREQLAWAKEQYGMDRDVADLVIESALDRQDSQDAVAARDRDRYESTFQPLEDQLAQEAQDYATPDRAEFDAGQAQADVSQQFEMARANATDKLEAFGVDPTQTRSQALDVSTRTQEAAARASAGNNARKQTEAIGRAMRSEAINVGKGYPGQIAQTYNTALQSGNQAVNSGIATTGAGANAMGNPTAWQGLSNQAIGQQWDGMNKAYSNQIDAFKAENSQSSGIGSALGLVGSLAMKGLPTGFLGKFEDGGAASDAAIPDDMQHNGVPVRPELSPSRGAIPDDIPARLNAGEFVVPKDVTSWKGEEFFQKLIEGSRTAKAGATAKPEMKPAAPQAPVLNTAIPMG